MRGGIHDRIQPEIQHEDKEAEGMVEEMLDAPPVSNKVHDLMMETEGWQIDNESSYKAKER